MRTIAVVQAKREAESDTISGVTKASMTHIYGTDTWAQDSDYVLIVNGKRSAPVRTISLDKAREGVVGDWTVNFKLDPFPIFSEVGSRVNSGGTVKFQGV